MSSKILYYSLVFLISGCFRTSMINSCPAIVNYSFEEQMELNKIREQIKSVLLDKFLIDYYNLREDLKLCNKKV